MIDFNKKRVTYLFPILVAFMILSAFVFPSVTNAVTNDRITGAMTEKQYKEKYSELNQVQNEVWNQKYNFRPEANPVLVDNWDDFQKAFENNSVSKITLKKNITSPYYSKAYTRTESLEIDGRGFKLEMDRSSLNFDDLTDLSKFTKNFSNVPVFHMHDIQIVNNTGYGALEGTLGTAWAFINGRGQFGPGGSAGGRRGLWQYRMGNITTPYDSSKTTDNQRVGGRLFNAELGQIDIWGYNKIVTGAENFYTGGIKYEPNTYYRGEIAHYNYSTIWFMLNPAQVGTGVNRNNLTGSQQFDIGENSFVYLNNTNTGTGFPAVYEHYNLLRVGENATYNANVPGTAVSFNESNSSFVAMKGAKVNLLSRRSGAPTISLVNSNSTHGTGSTIPPKNTSYQINEDVEFYVVGTNPTHGTGIVNFGNNNSTEGRFILDSPASFDIRNQHSTTKNVSFMGISKLGSLFSIKNSDISLWKSETTVDGLADIDAVNVATFSVVPNSDSGNVSTTSDALKSYTRRNYRRISGFNTKPELLWEPVTDADASQKARVLLGYVPVGGSDPFDENGDARVTPVYADHVRVVEADYEDTLGNTYTTTSQSDGYLYWKLEDHAIPGFQKAGEAVSGTPFRLDKQKVRYREGDKVSTTVVDVTPPEPAKINTDITTISKKINGTAEADSKVTMTINGIENSNLATTTDSQGKWEVEVPYRLLKEGDTLQVFLEDNALQISSDKNQAEAGGMAYLPANRIPVTNSATGNKNPKTDLKYSDAVFKAATKITVKSIEPPTPKINKIARALTKDKEGNQIPQTENSVVNPDDWKGTVTKVNNTLSYRITIQVPGTSGQDIQKILYNAKFTDTIPDYLTFNKEDVKAWVYKKGDAEDGLPIRYPDNVIGSDGKHQFNMGDIDLVSSEATELVNPLIEYEESTRLLTVGVGDRSKNTNDSYDKYGYEGSNVYGHLVPGDKVVIEFPTKVTAEAVKSTINNTAKITGYSAELISENSQDYKEITVTSNVAKSPGGDVIGELLLLSAPKTLEFGKVNLLDYNEPIGTDSSSIDRPLKVKDTLQDRDWEITVNLTTELTYQSHELPNSLYVRYKGENKTLVLNSPIRIYECDVDSLGENVEEINISESWSKDLTKDGIKLKASKIPHTGKYQGDLEWSLANTQ